ncbi:MAG: amino acid ABC transporter substrate-binding protein [Acidimicrobiaceae bacterium]|nr:amino acid ABC transporter substrate-binding protein [Acidimicrobiaceae bacterium]
MLALSLVAAACGDDDEPTADTTAEEPAEEPADTTAPAEEPTDEPAEEPADTTAPAEEPSTETTTANTDAAGGECDPLPLVQEGMLTVATGETVFPPWMGAGEDDFDDPTTGTGYEGALVFALAEEMGFTADQVTFVRTGFDEVIAPGDKDWDFNIQQYSITEDRDEVVDFSDGYYEVDQAIIGAADSPAASATSIADLKPLRIGAAIGTTSLDYAEQVIDPDGDVQVYDDNSAAKAAFDAGQVDAIVFDLPTAYYITAVEITDASVIGILPPGESADELGMLFEEGNPLVPCVNAALQTLSDNGTLDAIEQEWLAAGGDIPTLDS